MYVLINIITRIPDESLGLGRRFFVVCGATVPEDSVGMACARYVRNYFMILAHNKCHMPDINSTWHVTNDICPISICNIVALVWYVYLQLTPHCCLHWGHCPRWWWHSYPIPWGYWFHSCMGSFTEIEIVSG